MTRRPYTIAAMTLGVVAATACSALISLDAVQCKTNADCAIGLPGGVCVDSVCMAATASGDAGHDGGADSSDASGPGDDSDVDAALDPWRCVADPPEQLDPSAELTLTIRTFDALKPIVTAGASGGSDLDVVSATALPGVLMQPCNVLDTQCVNAVADAGTTDDSGTAVFVVPGNFAGYFEMTQATLFPSTFFPGNPLPDASSQSDPVPLLSVSGAQELAQTLGVPLATDPDSGVGHGFFLIYDCDDRHAAGVSISLGDAGADGSVLVPERERLSEQRRELDGVARERRSGELSAGCDSDRRHRAVYR